MKRHCTSDIHWANSRRFSVLDKVMVIPDIILLGDATTQELQVMIKAIKSQRLQFLKPKCQCPGNANKRNFDLPWESVSSVTFRVHNAN